MASKPWARAGQNSAFSLVSTSRSRCSNHAQPSLGQILNASRQSKHPFCCLLDVEPPSTTHEYSNPLRQFTLFLKQPEKLFQQIVLYPIIIINALLLIYLSFYKAYLEDSDKQASRNLAQQGEQRQGKLNVKINRKIIMWLVKTEKHHLWFNRV